MHYGGYDASNNGKPTIIDRSTNQPAPENKQISANDFAQVLNPTNAVTVAATFLRRVTEF